MEDRPECTAIVFLHGSGTTSAVWEDAMSRFGGRYHCLAPDLPGHGDNRALPWRSLFEQLTVLPHGLGAERRMGVHTSSACRLVGKWPLSWLGIPRESSGMLLSTARGVVPSRVALLLKAGVFLISPFLYRRAVIKRLGRFLGVPPQNLPSSTAGIRAVDPRTVRRAFADSQDPDVLDDVLRSKAPTLLISGEAELGDVRAANAALC